eukprot:GFKZ01013134.1.p4 GENE.GFKZ01013134.1~~GFKZ01013134.1.p4  ORF type:complete len:115 (-),score=5.50 GFKZ01013134.1:1031-1375(-)
MEQLSGSNLACQKARKRKAQTFRLRLSIGWNPPDSTHSRTNVCRIPANVAHRHLFTSVPNPPSAFFPSLDASFIANIPHHPKAPSPPKPSPTQGFPQATALKRQGIRHLEHRRE